MAMEIEYADVEESTLPETTDAAEIVNGDGGSGVANEAVVEVEPASVDAFDGEANEADADGISDNQGEVPSASTTLAVIESESRRPSCPQSILDNPQEAIAFHERCDLAELVHKNEVSAAKEEHFSLVVQRSDLEIELKEAKADEKSALQNLKNLIRRGPSYPQPASAIAKAVSEGGERSAIQVDDANADQSWRLVPTSQVIEGIAGLGPKKAEAIISLAPTLGDLEELRAQAGIAHKPLASVLPKGVGGSLADEIEERILDATKQHMKRLEEVAVVVEDVESDSSEATTDQPG